MLYIQAVIFVILAIYTIYNIETWEKATAFRKITAIISLIIATPIGMVIYHDAMLQLAKL